MAANQKDKSTWSSLIPYLVNLQDPGYLLGNCCIVCKLCQRTTYKMDNKNFYHIESIQNFPLLKTKIIDFCRKIILKTHKKCKNAIFHFNNNTSENRIGHFSKWNWPFLEIWKILEAAISMWFSVRKNIQIVVILHKYFNIKMRALWLASNIGK